MPIDPANVSLNEVIDEIRGFESARVA